MWNYAYLTHMAKVSGGPTQFVNTIATVSRSFGRAEMIPVVGLTFCIGGALGIVSTLLCGNSQAKMEAIVVAAKEELLESLTSQEDCSDGKELIEEPQEGSECI